jgi:hypothetical protein
VAEAKIGAARLGNLVNSASGFNKNNNRVKQALENQSAALIDFIGQKKRRQHNGITDRVDFRQWENVKREFALRFAKDICEGYLRD